MSSSEIISNSINGIKACDLGSLLSCFEEVQPLLEKEISLQKELLSNDFLNDECDVNSSVEYRFANQPLFDRNTNEIETNSFPSIHIDDVISEILEDDDWYYHLNASEDKGDANGDVSCPNETKKDVESNSDSSWTDDSSSEMLDNNHSALGSPHHYRGRGCNFGRHKKGGGSVGGLMGRGRSYGMSFNQEAKYDLSSEGTQVYNKLPSYYTALSRPAHGIKRNIHLNPSELEFPDDNQQPSYESIVLDKIPSYQSCFTNSMKYDDVFNVSKISRSDVSTPVDESSHHHKRELLRSDGRKHCSRARHKYNKSVKKARSRSRGRSKSRGRSRSRGRSKSQGRSKGRARTAKKSSRDVEISTPGDNCVGMENETRTQDLNAKSKSLLRRIVYIGRIPQGYSRNELMECFGRFGGISECSVHFRESGDNYGFVTYEDVGGSKRAVENGNKLPGCEHWDICFGGRRKFCKADYTDLDGNMQVTEEFIPGGVKVAMSFDELLRDTIRNR